jgi:hypothetical protein
MTTTKVAYVSMGAPHPTPSPLPAEITTAPRHRSRSCMSTKPLDRTYSQLGQRLAPDAVICASLLRERHPG